MLSRGRIGLPHAGHALGGLTTDSPRGTRQMTTLRNEPTSAPRTKQAYGSRLSGKVCRGQAPDSRTQLPEVLDRHRSASAEAERPPDQGIVGEAEVAAVV